MTNLKRERKNKKGNHHSEDSMNHLPLARRKAGRPDRSITNRNIGTSQPRPAVADKGAEEDLEIEKDEGEKEKRRSRGGSWNTRSPPRDHNQRRKKDHRDPQMGGRNDRRQFIKD